MKSRTTKNSRQRTERLAQNTERLRRDGELTLVRAERFALHGNDVADVGLAVAFEAVVAELLALDVDLDAPGAILEVEKCSFAEVAHADDAPGDAHDLGLLLQPLGIHVAEARSQLADRAIGSEIVGIGAFAACA